MELMTSHHNYQRLHNLVTGDEKWVLYINYGYHRQWLSPGQTGVVTPKPDLHPKKVMLTREHSQVIRSVCLHILPTCKDYYSKKKPKRIWALIASFKSYEVFRFLYSKVIIFRTRKRNFTINMQNRIKLIYPIKISSL